MISTVSLWVVILMCTAGVFGRVFDDNLLQRIGLGCVVVGCVPWLFEAPAWLVVVQHVGMASYALGTALKVWQRRPRRGPPTPPVHHRPPWVGSPRS